jgi:alpha-mannosidase/lysosomal alpha-mannosidase
MLLLILISIACLQEITANILGKVSKFESDLLRVYLFPHSHDDVGWVRTLNEYYEDRRGVR